MVALFLVSSRKNRLLKMPLPSWDIMNAAVFCAILDRLLIEHVKTLGSMPFLNLHASIHVCKVDSFSATGETNSWML